jgi:uncharacterized membrane protein YozB (DUF420 family)
MTWVLAGWLFVAFLLAVVTGGSVRLANRRSGTPTASSPVTTAGPGASRRPVAGTPRRRTVPVPPAGVALIAIALVLELAGYVARLADWSGQAGRLLSMDGVGSVPRMYVAALFAAAALAAAAGASNIPGRRTWWLAVALIAGGIAAVKAGSTVHSDVVAASNELLGSRLALIMSVGAATTVVCGLWYLSRNEQRDRRRMLTVLALYAVASVGLSAVSFAVQEAYGRASTWAAATTFVEETGEALAGVMFLIAVLVGVAPRLVLPHTWALRRTADDSGLAVAEGMPGQSTAKGAVGK